MSLKNSRKLKLIDQTIKELEYNLTLAKERRDSVYKSYKVVCPSCSSKTKVQDLFKIPEMRYYKSYSAYEDPSWENTANKHYSVCPKCNTLMLLSQDFVNEFKEYFKKPEVQHFSYGWLELRDNSDGRNRKGKISFFGRRDSLDEYLINFKDLMDLDAHGKIQLDEY